MENDILSITTLHNLLDYDARKLISAEVQVESILPVWIDKAETVELKIVLQKYLELVRQHIQQLRAFSIEENVDSLSRTNNVMQALIIDTREHINNCTGTEVKDAGLLACIQNINHYKMSLYGTAAAFAKSIGKESVATNFHEAGENERDIDNSLSQIAKREINNKASAPVKLSSSN